jgi:anhydro-N-acetylmuramic acid kinase
MLVIGLMSGTSLDGVDAAVIETDGQSIHSFGPTLTIPYDPELRAGLKELIEHIRRSPPDPPSLSEAVTVALTAQHIEAVRRLSTKADLIGFHGQTVLHAPEHRITRQIGDAQALATATHTPVACDFRLADVQAGGQGAPLAPLFHQALVNIGGVANLTFIGHTELLACDTGPGNALLDDFLDERTGTPMDRDGLHALRGTPSQTVLDDLLKNPFFAAWPPKSLDRDHFSRSLQEIAALGTEDGAATLAAFTAQSIAATPLPSAPRRVLVTGGGRKNPAIMAALKSAFPVPVDPVENEGWDGDALEAQCFGYLAMRVLRGLPLSLPGTTGAPRPMPGGRIVSP